MNHVIRPIVAGMMLVAALPEGLAQANYPTRPIRVIVPTAPGGPPDVVARLIAQDLVTRLGQPVVVENKAGAGTIIGSEFVARAPADGYTLLLSPTPLATNPPSYKKMPYDALRDFAPITQTHFVPNLFVIHPSLPVKSVKEFIAVAKGRPDEILYASAGYGTAPHLTIELFASMAGVKLVHVPYKGGLPGVADLLTGRVAMMVTSALGWVLPHVHAGKLRALAFSSLTRNKTMPDIPTMAETVPGFEAVQWAGLLAPAGTPPAIISRLHKEVVTILRKPETRKRLATDAAEVVASAPEEFAAYLRSETQKWAKVAKSAGIVPN